VDVLIRNWVIRWWVQILIGIGIILRLADYFGGRSYWMDEGSLAGNIQSKGWAELFGPLMANQLAPPGFLLVESILCRLFGAGTYSLRLFPLIGGIASLFLLQGVATRLLRHPGAVGIAVGLACLADDLIYYSAELKQYSTDVAFGLLCYRIALDALTRTLTWGRSVAYAILGAVVVWFSHPAVFILAGLGTVLLGSALGHRDWQRAIRQALIGSAWVLSFVGVHWVAMEQLGHRGEMWVFWDFAFPHLPPTSFWDVTWIVRRILYFLVNPLSFNSPLGPLPSVLAVFALLLVGCVSLAKVRPTSLGMLILPATFTLFATYLHKYPFHGRLVLFLVPAFLMLIAEGAAWVWNATQWRVLRGAIVVVLFLFPSLDLIQSMSSPISRGFHNYVGDRRPEKLNPARFPWE